MDASPSLAEPVPVALFVYRRWAQLPRTLECLRASGIERLYVFSDGPKDAADAADVAAVRDLIASLEWIEPAAVVAHPGNVGLSGSIRAGLDWLFESHEAAIVVEDDICVAPEFYDYARLTLGHYRDAARIAGITGLRYPFDRGAFGGYAYDVFLSPRFSSWGWATWRDRWQAFTFDTSVLRGQLAARADLRSERAGADMPWMIERAVVEESLTGSWDVACAANMLLHDQYFVTPTWNMVENSGLTEGTHQVAGAPAWTLAWEPEHRPTLGDLKFAPLAEDPRVLRTYVRFFAPSRRQALVAALARLRRRFAHG